MYLHHFESHWTSLFWGSQGSKEKQPVVPSRPAMPGFLRLFLIGNERKTLSFWIKESDRHKSKPNKIMSFIYLRWTHFYGACPGHFQSLKACKNPSESEYTSQCFLKIHAKERSHLSRVRQKDNLTMIWARDQANNCKHNGSLCFIHIS